MVNNKLKIATPISHLFENSVQAKNIINASDCLECRDYSVSKTYKNQEVFHCDLQPIQNLGNQEFTYLKKVKQTKKNLKLISFHLASCYDNPKIKEGKFIPGGNKLSRERLLNNALKNFSKIKEIFGVDVELAVENNNYYKTEAYDYITDPEFIRDIVNNSDISFLFDIAHARVSAINQGISFDNYVNRLPLNQLIQIHISRAGYNDKGEFIDKHELPGNTEIEEVVSLLDKYPTVRYITVEYYRNAQDLITLLNQINIRING